jgi:hypothetical protein
MSEPSFFANCYRWTSTATIPLHGLEHPRNKLVKPILITLSTLGALLIVTVGWVVGIFVRLSKRNPTSGAIAVDTQALMLMLNWHNAPFYWLTLLLVIVLAGVAYWRWA